MKKITYLIFIGSILIGCKRTQQENPRKPTDVGIAALKVCDCNSVSVSTSSKNGWSSIDITVEKTKLPDFEKRITKIMKQVKKDVKGFCDTDEINIHFVSNTYKIEDRSYLCECPEEKVAQPDTIMSHFSSGFTSKSSSSRIVQRDSGQQVLILAIRDLDESVKSKDETIEYLKEKLRGKYPQFCDSIDEIVIELYTGEEGYEATTMQCEDFFNHQ